MFNMNTLRCLRYTAKERRKLGCSPSGFACQTLDQVRLLGIVHDTIPLADISYVTT